MNDIDIQLTDKNYSQNRELIISIQETERQRIARDLHDTSLQNLTYIINQLELCNLYMDKDITRAKLELLSAKQGVKFVIDEIRDIIYDLRPMTFDDLGLQETFENFFSVLRKNYNFEFKLNIQPIECNNEFILFSIYSVTKECVLNALNHSGGNKLIFECTSDDSYCFLYVEDNGSGFSKQDIIDKKNHFGLSVVFERVSLLNGEISFETGENKGTKVSIKIPLDFQAH